MKKILIAVLALAVVFGFAACDNSTGNVSADELRENGTVVNTKEYLPGEAVSVTDFTFTVYTVDGTPKSVEASEVVMNGSEVADADAADYQFVWNGVKFTGGITVNTVKSIVVDATASNVKKDYYATDYNTDAKYTNDLLDLAGVKIEITYTDAAGKEQKKTVEATDLSGVTATITNWNPKLTAGSASATVEIAYAEQSGSYEVTLNQNFVDSVALVAADEDAVYYVGGTYTQTAVKMVATMLNGETKDLTVGTDYKFVDEYDKYTESTLAIDASKAGDITIKAQYQGTNGKPGMAAADKLASLKITIVEDEVVDLKVTAPANVKSGDKAADTNGYGFTVQCVMGTDESVEDASGTTLTYGASTNGFTVTPVEITAEAGENVVITVTGSGITKTYTLPVIAATSEPDAGDGGQ